MIIREKTKRRLRFCLCTAVALCLIAVGAYFLRLRQLEQRAIAKRAQGLELLKAGDYFQALHSIGPYLQRHPEDVETLFPYAQARQNVPEPNNRHIADAIGLYQRVLDLQPNHPEARRALLDLYVSWGYDTEATALADTILKDQLDDAQALTAKTKVLIRRREFKEAAKVARDHAKLRPLDFDTQSLALIAMQRAEAPADDLVEHVVELRRKHGERPLFDLLQSAVYTINSDREKAIEFARKAAAAAPLDATLAEALASRLDELELFSEAFSVIERAAREAGGDEQKRALAVRLFAAARYADLISLTESAGIVGDTDLAAYRALALAKLDRRTEAVEIATSLLEQKDDPYATRWGKVLSAVFSDGESAHEVIISALTEALRQSPNNALLHSIAGEAYTAVGEHDAALRHWHSAFLAAPAWYEPLERMSQLLVGAQRFKEAAEAAERARKRAPERVEPKISLALAWAAMARRGKTDLTPALLTLVDEIQAQVPGEAQTLPIRPWLLARSGQPNAAQAAIRAALTLPKVPEEQTLLELGAISRRAQLGLEEACWGLSQKTHGLTPDLGFVRARVLQDENKPQDGLALLEGERQRAADRDTALKWEIARARYLELIEDARADSAWITLADSRPENADLQWLALSTSTVRHDREFVSRALERLRGPRQGVRWQLVRAQYLLDKEASKEDALDAALILNELTRTVPELPTPRVLLAKSMEKLGNTSGAIEQLKKANNLQPESTAIALELARLLHTNGDYVQAREHIDRAINSGNTTRQQRHVAATLVAQQGDADAALKLLEADLNPADLPPDRTLAMIFRKRNEPEKVDAILKKLLIDPDVAVISFAADFYAAKNRRAEAEAVLARLNALPADAGDKHLARAEFYRVHGPAEQVVAEYEAAIKAAPQNPVPWRQLAVHHLTGNRSAEAAAIIASAARALPGNPTFEAAQKNAAFLADGKGNSALMPLLVWLLENPGDGPALAEVLPAVAGAFAKDASPASAATNLRPFADRYTRIIPLQNVVAEHYLAAGRAADAVTVASRAMQAAPNAPAPARLAVIGLATQQRWPEVLATAQQWRDRAGDHPREADQMIALAHTRMGNPAAARAQLQPYVKLAMEEPDANRSLIVQFAEAEIAVGSANAAAELLRPMLGRSPQWRHAWMQLASQADPDAGVAWLKEADAHVPHDPIEERFMLISAWDALARRSNRPKDLATAQFMTSALADRSSTATPELMLAFASLQENQSNADGAEKTYRLLLAKAPENPIAQNNLAMLLARRNEKLTEALELASKAAAMPHPNQANFLDSLAFVRAAMGSHEEALKSIEAALKLQPNDLVFQIHQAKILVHSGNTDQAAQALRRIEARHPDLSRLTAAARADVEALQRKLRGAS